MITYGGKLTPIKLNTICSISRATTNTPETNLMFRIEPRYDDVNANIPPRVTNSEMPEPAVIRKR